MLMGRRVQTTACGSTWACGRGTWWNPLFVGDDSNTFWALTAGILLLVAYVGLVGVIEGSTRRRMVTTGVTLDEVYVEVLSGLAAGERVALR